MNRPFHIFINETLYLVSVYTYYSFCYVVSA